MPFSAARFHEIDDEGRALPLRPLITVSSSPRKQIKRRESRLCHEALETSTDRWAVCNFLPTKVEKEMLVVTDECGVGVINILPCVIYAFYSPEESVLLPYRVRSTNCRSTDRPSCFVVWLSAFKQTRHRSRRAGDSYIRIMMPQDSNGG